MTLRSIVLVAMLIAAGGCALGAIWFFWSSDDEARRQANFRKMIEVSRSDRPQGRLAKHWLECLERESHSAGRSDQRVRCASWSAQGITSTLIAVGAHDAIVPVVETQIPGTAQDGRYIIDVVGGPGDDPFHVEPDVDDALFDRLESSGRPARIWRDMRRSPYRDLMDHGYTIVSVGYWGTLVRTLQEPDEIELAFDDVRTAVNYYRDQSGAEPPLVTSSLGNHIALGALGRDRLERMEVLALVPVMDGLQHHIARSRRELEKERAKADTDADLVGSWRIRNIYRRSGDGVIFDRSEMLPLRAYVERYVGAHDLAWKGIEPKGKCSRILLGALDPRTRDYLRANKNLPPHVIVLGADHDLADRAPEDVRGLFFDFADCLTKQEA
ncbi:hypothetical protein I5L01_00405 [Erythrobacter sp. YJ-T3-07]|uniref:hypothetical protein n=1 Tax=Erythrobacter sp. YJ-T3-07 TaxID=2793063 RepID=UPI0018D2E0EC|nr:hypothetical protein [Erythrobacter sp. YJ-T3-07]MBH1942679.1 hypothetical protein [Erythrobacter sp. YJ-T3-07]